MKKYFQEIFEYPIKEFKEHIENPFNERIIFSGKYGIGKTKFLESIFESKNQEKIFGSDKYEAYRIFPINYSISSNEDILRYIKYDIILELLRKISDVEEIDLSYLNTLPTFIKNNLHKVAAAMVYMVPKLGKEVVEAFDRIDKLKEQFFKFHDKVNESSGDKMIKYLEGIEATEGSLYENDIITKIISDTLKGDNSKETVLIVDDVDRLDPEHLFRILNVFAAHFDRSIDQKNKFNFDKIIIVCDFHNIRNAFHYRHGDEVDFMGYIDKFYSSDIYHFDNKKAIIGILGNVFNSIQFLVRDGESVDTFNQLYFRDNFLTNLVSLLVEKNYISLRSIIKNIEKKVDYHHEPLFFINRHGEVYPWMAPVTMELKLLRDFLGEYQNMRKALIECSKRNEYIHNYEFLFGKFISVLAADKHTFRRDDLFRFNYKGNELVVNTKSNRFNGIDWVDLYYFEGQEGNRFIQKTPFTPSLELFWHGLLDTVDCLYKIGYLK